MNKERYNELKDKIVEAFKELEDDEGKFELVNYLLDMFLKNLDSMAKEKRVNCLAYMSEWKTMMKSTSI